jgi:hypothetical protein
VFYRLAPNVADRLGAIAGGLVAGATIRRSSLATRARAGTPGDPVPLNPRASQV